MKKIVILIPFLFACLFIHAQTVSDSDRQVMEKIKQANVKYTSIVSDFKQTKHLSFMGEDIVSSGKFYYNKPDRLAMRYDSPEGDLMLIDGGKMVMITAGKQTSTKSNNRTKEMKTILSSCLQGDIEQMEASKISCEETSKYYVVTAEIERTNKSNISKAVMSYEKTNMTLSVLRLEEPDNSYTVYELTGKELDKPIDPNVFQVSKK